MRKVKLLMGLCLLGMMGSLSLNAANLSLAMGAVGDDTKVYQEYLDTWSKKTGHTAKVVTMPSSTTDQFGQYKIWLGAKNTDIDVYMLDVIWAPQIADHFVDLSKVAKKDAAQHFKSVIKSQTVGKKLVALPAFTDAPMLYYRKDLLEKYGEKVPKTWEELKKVARRVQDAEREAGNTKIHGFVFQGNAYEGLTCDALEWVASYGGGTIVSPTGKPQVNNRATINALNMAKGFIGNISPKGVLSYQEEEARGVWQLGNAVFMRNWPYAYSLGNESGSKVKGIFDVVPLPKGAGARSTSAATLGGWNMGVSTYSKNQKAAIDLVKYITGEEVQKLNAKNRSKLPTIEKLYSDKEVLASSPFLPTMRKVLKNAVARPAVGTGRNYAEVSKEFFTSVHAVLSGDKTAANAMAELDRRLKRVLR